MILTNFSDDLPQLSNDQITNYKNSFEWWYFDIECDNNISLVIILKRKDIFTHEINPSVYVEYIVKDKKDTLVEIYPKDEYNLKYNKQTNGAVISIGNSYLKVIKDKENIISSYELHVDLKILRVNIKFKPLHQGFKVSKNGVYFTHKKQEDLINCVNFAAPRMEGKGNLTLFQESYDINGEGYHDHPWGTSHLLQTNKNWHWARLYNEHASIMYADVKPHGDYKGNFKFLYFSYYDEFLPKVEENYTIVPKEFKREQGSRMKFPHELTIICPNLNLEINTKFLRTNLNIVIYNRSSVSFELNESKKKFKTKGNGWTEYWNVPSWLRGLLIKKNRSEQSKHVKKTQELINKYN